MCACVCVYVAKKRGCFLDIYWRDKESEKPQGEKTLRGTVKNKRERRGKPRDARENKRVQERERERELSFGNIIIFLGVKNDPIANLTLSENFFVRQDI